MESGNIMMCQKMNKERICQQPEAQHLLWSLKQAYLGLTHNERQVVKEELCKSGNLN